MKDQQQVRRVPIAVIAGVCGLVLAAGGGIAWWTANRTSSLAPDSAAPTAPTITPNPATSPPIEIPVPPPLPTQTPQSQQSPTVTPSPGVTSQPLPTTERAPQAYWLKDVGGKFQIVPTQVALNQPPAKPDVALQVAFDRLLTGPAEGMMTSEIPSGTKLQSLAVKGDSVYVDLSKDFTSGGGSVSMMGRLGQVIYTASSLKPDAKVWISINGKPLEVLGGEGLEVAQPSTRQTFEQSFGIQ